MTVSHPPLRVSDHALLRFIERAGGLDVEAVRSALQTSLTRALTIADALGVADFTIRADGLSYLVRNGVIITILKTEK